VPAVGSDEELAIRLLETEGIVVYPGHFYDFAKEGYLVVSLIASTDHFCQGVEKLLQAV
jgi:aspartate/methionine/tyrosine aminotransferase